MNDWPCFKTAFKACRLKKKQTAGRNNSGRITSYHRGGGSKRLYRQIDFERNLGEHGPGDGRVGFPTRIDEPKLEFKPVTGAFDNLVANILSIGTVQRLEYDPNRSAQIALIKWVLPSMKFNSLYKDQESILKLGTEIKSTQLSGFSGNYIYFSYIIACNKLRVGDQIFNSGAHTKLKSFNLPEIKNIDSRPSSLSKKEDKKLVTNNGFSSKEVMTQTSSISQNMSLPTKVGNSGPLSFIPLGCFIYNIEIKPGSGGQLVRSAGTYAQLIQNRKDINQTIIRLPSGILKQLDSRCRATIGTVSNSSHSITAVLKKAGQNRWLGKRPIVRGVAMNPIDHPHGGGEGRTKGGRPSVSPWGKPTKGGFKTSRRVSSRPQKWLES